VRRKIILLSFDENSSKDCLGEFTDNLDALMITPTFLCDIKVLVRKIALKPVKYDVQFCTDWRLGLNFKQVHGKPDFRCPLQTSAWQA